MKFIKTFSTIIVAILLLAYPVYYFMSKHQSDKKKFSLESPEKRDISNFILSSGTIIPEKEVLIKSRVAGVLDDIFVKSGDAVSKNQIIAKIKVIPDLVALANAQADVSLARLDFKNKEEAYKRDSLSFEAGLTTLANFQNSQTTYLQSEENLEKSIANYEIIKSGGQQNQNNTLIRSTIDGVVTLLPTKVGASIIQSNNFNDGTTIAKIADIQQLIFDGNVQEYEVSGLKLEMPVTITSSVNEIESLGNLSEIATSAETVDGNIVFNIKSRLNAVDYKRTGFSAVAKIVTKEKKDVLAINEKWITFENDSSFVFVNINEEKDEKRYVKLGISDGVYAEVLSNLSKDDKIRVYD